MNRVESAAKRSGKALEDITLVAVTKTHPVETIIEAVNAGVTDIGENKIQEAETKFSELDLKAPDLKFTRHFIGHLQTNKVKKALRYFDLIHSIDSKHLAEAVSSEAEKSGIDVEALVQVNTSEEDSKFGADPEDIIDLVKFVSRLPRVKIRGLMTIGAFLPDPEDVRPCFRMLRELSDEIKNAGLEAVDMKYLSMGMTNDFETAIEEGANIIRVGTAIFGPRRYN